jgi:hypothetical protein
MNIETAKEIHVSLLWEEICKELDERINKLVVSLRKCTPETLSIIQAKIATLEEIKRLPQDVIEREE